MKELYSQKRRIGPIPELPLEFLTALKVFFDQDEGEKVELPMEQLEKLAWDDYSGQFVGRVRPDDVSSEKGDRLIRDRHKSPLYVIL